MTGTYGPATGTAIVQVKPPGVTDHTTYAWGSNQAADLSDAQRSTPRQVGTDTRWTAGATNSYGTVALQS